MPIQEKTLARRLRQEKKSQPSRSLITPVQPLPTPGAELPSLSEEQPEEQLEAPTTGRDQERDQAATLRQEKNRDLMKKAERAEKTAQTAQKATDTIAKVKKYKKLWTIISAVGSFLISTFPIWGTILAAIILIIYIISLTCDTVPKIFYGLLKEVSGISCESGNENGSTVKTK